MKLISKEQRFLLKGFERQIYLGERERDTLLRKIFYRHRRCLVKTEDNEWIKVLVLRVSDGLVYFKYADMDVEACRPWTELKGLKNEEEEL